LNILFFIYTDRSSIWYNREFNSWGTHTYIQTRTYYWVWRNLIHGRKVNDLGKRFHATHINRQTRRLITTLYGYLPLVSINNTAAPLCSYIVLLCTQPFSHTGTYSWFFIPVLLITLTIAFNEFLLNVFVLFFVSPIVSYKGSICSYLCINYWLTAYTIILKYNLTYIYSYYCYQKIRLLLFLQLSHVKVGIGPYNTF